MGDPKRIRKKYSKPRHPWEKERIDEEKKLARTYGFANKKEIWKVQSKLKNFKDLAKSLAARSGKQAERETQQLLQKLRNYALLKEDQNLNDILGITADTVSERRLQTLVYKKNLARSVKQARQLIVHRHIRVNNQKITAPSYLVSVSEEPTITFATDSPFASQEHPERFVAEEDLAVKPEEKEELALKKEKEQKTAKKAAKKESTNEKSPAEASSEKEQEQPEQPASAKKEDEKEKEQQAKTEKAAETATKAS